MRKVWSPAIVAALVAAACGSTVPAPTTQAPASGGLSAPGSTSGTTTTGGGGGGLGGGGGTGSGTGGAGGSVGGGGTSGGSVNGGAGGSGAGGGAVSASAPGVTSSTISFGLVYLKNQEQANCAVGACGAGGGDARDAYNVVINELNKHGGLLGRKVVPVYAAIDVNSTTPVDQQWQAACAEWTQDHKVFSINVGNEPIVEECAKKAGAAELTSSVTGGGSVPETYQRYPNYVEMVGINLVRLGPVTVDGLAKQGYFDKGAKIGMVTWNDPAYKEGLEKGYLPALRKHGLSLATDPVYLTPPQTVQDLGATSAEVNGAVLQFSSMGIDHVMFLGGRAGLCGVGCMEVLWMRRAQGQDYHPRYGFNDNDAPATLLAAGLYPPEQLRRSISVAWLDIDKTYDAGWRVNTVRERCYELMRKHGVFMGSPNAQANALGACDEFSFLDMVFGRLGGTPLSVASFISEVEGVGNGFTSTSVYDITITPAQHDGVAAVRTMKFVDSCKCYKYTSDPYRV